MNGSSPRRAHKLLREALSYPAAERDAFFVRACGENSDLLAEVRQLYAKWATDEPLTLPTAGAEEAPPGGVPIEGPGTRIGPYTLIENLGEGGFGVVYLAQQDEPVRRRVALKIIKLGMDTRAVIARFEAERQALAIMDHPGIAKVLDAGATNTGRPYFVMELVRGVPITRYCDEKQLPLEGRLDLFAQTCRAVQHAHHKGVIHRDLKPGNILVTELDGVPVPKVIDFGVAKATSARLTDRTLFTELKQIIGTPEYMSPEQAQEGAEDIDTRADIYSLGVVLYELLTGVTPFEPGRLRSAAYAEIQRIIREEDPPTPSTRLSSIHDSIDVIAARRSMQPRRLGEALRGELDWIVMKSMEKDRARRYDSAAALAQDIERHLSNEPVSAGPPSHWYKARKFVRRNRAGVAAAATIALLLIGGSGAVGWAGWRAMKAEALATERLGQREEALRQAEAQSQRAEEALGEARTQRSRAEVALKRQESVNTFFIERMLRSAKPNESRGREWTVVELVDIVADGVDQIDDPIVRAAVLKEVAAVYWERGRRADARARWAEALELITADGPAADPRFEADLVASLANAELAGGDPARVLALIDRFDAIVAGGVSVTPTTAGTVRISEASAAQLAGDFQRMLDAAERGIARLPRFAASRGQDLARAELLGRKSAALLHLGRPEDALAAAEEGVDAAATMRDSSFLGNAMLQEAMCLAHLGRDQQAIALTHQATEMLERFVFAESAAAGYRLKAAQILVEAGAAAEAAGQVDLALKAARASGGEADLFLPPSLLLRGMLRADAGDLTAARSDLEEAMSLLIKSGRAGDGELASYRIGMARLLHDEGRTSEALSELRRVIDGDGVAPMLVVKARSLLDAWMPPSVAVSDKPAPAREGDR